MTTPPVKIRPIEPEDYDGWLKLWNGNNNGQLDLDVTAKTWARLNDPESTVHGLVAETLEGLAGLTHYILHPVTGSTQPACYMQDMYVDPGFRRKGIARKMVHRLADVGKREHWARLYWLAEADNEGAQELYKNIGAKLNFTFHVMMF